MQPTRPIFNSYFVDLRANPRPAPVKEARKNVEIEICQHPFIRDINQIDALQSINGVSIAEIEQRCRPSSYALSGFLGADESFKEVLKTDWQTVAKLGTTHCELAAHLRNIVEMAMRNLDEMDEYEWINVTYHPSDLKGNTIKDSKPQNLRVSLAATRGFQQDIFEPAKNVIREAQTPEMWNDDYTIHHVDNNVKININQGILSYIELFGFYEGGGEHNRYRVGPDKIMAILRG